MHCLVVTATVWMIDGVHGHSTDSWVEFAAGLGPVVSGPGLEKWFLSATMAAENTNSGSALGWQVLGVAAGHPDSDGFPHPSINNRRVSS